MAAAKSAVVASPPGSPLCTLSALSVCSTAVCTRSARSASPTRFSIRAAASKSASGLATLPDLPGQEAPRKLRGRSYKVPILARTALGVGRPAPARSCGKLTFDRSSATASLGGRPLSLRRREAAALAVLMAHAGKLVRKERSISEVSSFDESAARTRSRPTSAGAAASVRPTAPRSERWEASVIRWRRRERATDPLASSGPASKALGADQTAGARSRLAVADQPDRRARPLDGSVKAVAGRISVRRCEIGKKMAFGDGTGSGAPSSKPIPSYAVSALAEARSILPSFPLLRRVSHRLSLDGKAERQYCESGPTRRHHDPGLKGRAAYFSYEQIWGTDGI